MLRKDDDKLIHVSAPKPWRQFLTQMQEDKDPSLDEPLYGRFTDEAIASDRRRD